MSGVVMRPRSPPATRDMHTLLRPTGSSSSSSSASSTAARRRAPGTPVTSTPAPLALPGGVSGDLGSDASGRRHLRRLLRLSRSGESVTSAVATPAPLSLRIGETMTPLPQTPLMWGGYANTTPGVPLGGFAPEARANRGDDTPEETTPLYQRFGLTQSSDNSSVMSSSLFSQNSQSMVLLGNDAGDEASMMESDAMFDQHHRANAVDLGDEDEDEEAFLNQMESPQRQDQQRLGTEPGFAFDGSSSFVEALLGHATKRRRVYLDDVTTSASDADAKDAQSATSRQSFWTQCDASRLVRIDHIALMNGDVAGSGHRALTILGSDPSVHTKEQIAATVQHDPCAGSHWAAYFPICELQHVWSKLVSSMYFWGDRFATSASIRLVTSSPAVKYAQAQLNARSGDEAKEMVGFDTMLRLVQRGDVSEDELLCCAVVPCSRNATLGEIRRTGVSLMASLPGEYSDGPVHFRGGDGDEGNVLENSRGDGEKGMAKTKKTGANLVPAPPPLPPQSVLTENDHMCESTFRMCRERIAPAYQTMSALGTICGEKRKREQLEEEDRKDFVLYQLSGIVWKVAKDSVTESLWSKPGDPTETTHVPGRRDVPGSGSIPGTSSE